MDNDVLEEKIKVANNRIQKLEDKVDSLSDFKFTVNQLSDTVKDLKITVESIKNEPSEDYKKFKFNIINYILLAIIGFILAYIGLK